MTGDAAFLKSHLEVTLLFFLASLITSFIGLFRGFYKIPLEPAEKSSVLFRHLLSGFVIYLGVSFLLAQLYIKVIKKMIPSTYGSTERYIFFSGWVNFVTIGTVFIGLLILASCMNREAWRQIWKAKDSRSSYGFDVSIGFAAWFIAYPLVVFANQILEIIVHVAFDLMVVPEQVAVEFLRTTLASSFFFLLGLISVVFFAPVVEEFLFRGLLQSWFKRYCSRKFAIFFTALCFSLFHFSMRQGLGNIPIIGSLFVFACFLGFVYERQKSLIASMALHATFNGLSVFNMVFFT